MSQLLVAVLLCSADTDEKEAQTVCFTFWLAERVEAWIGEVAPSQSTSFFLISLSPPPTHPSLSSSLVCALLSLSLPRFQPQPLNSRKKATAAATALEGQGAASVPGRCRRAGGRHAPSPPFLAAAPCSDPQRAANRRRRPLLLPDPATSTPATSRSCAPAPSSQVERRSSALHTDEEEEDEVPAADDSVRGGGTGRPRPVHRGSGRHRPFSTDLLEAPPSISSAPTGLGSGSRKRDQSMEGVQKQEAEAAAAVTTCFRSTVGDDATFVESAKDKFRQFKEAPVEEHWACLKNKVNSMFVEFKFGSSGYDADGAVVKDDDSSK
ncbi:uncharacterized protein LOC104584721 isoform X3 [Brachypodium distachyon]|uniref:uncharacterized protein LOC104584721 isoform X3 n=1 Tax=Brachypodium distachyon TaxID=15368 RepID=UPI00071D6B8D|nr:uncharacterized protein LOC104584721 isoform X3 [Brachypodium distachyon]|eukprot:XP_014752201.1 uncharacterized protein LOC104584721 isoform X3 [Brachypodium distachyon]